MPHALVGPISDNPAMPDAIPALLILAALAGWTTARYRRARTDHQDAKSNVEVRRQILGVERRTFAVVAVIVFFVVWWWLASHS